MLPIYFAIAWLVLPTLIFLACLCVNRRTHFVWSAMLCVASMFAGTYLLMQSVLTLDAHLLAEIDRHEPGSPEADQAMEAWASDTGRSFTFLVSPVLTGVWYAGVLGLLFGSRWVLGSRSSSSADPTDTTTNYGTTPMQINDGNPYHPPIVH